MVNLQAKSTLLSGRGRLSTVGLADIPEEHHAGLSITTPVELHQADHTA
jgi:hypothetical protein